MLMKNPICILMVVAVTIACFVHNSAAELSCLDEDGKPVDWFLGYKFPKIAGDSLFESGEAYSYITSDDINQNNEISNHRVKDSDSKIFLYKFRDLLLRYIGYTGKDKPKIAPKRARTSRIQQGKDGKTKWIASNKQIGSPDSIMMRTLAIAYDEELGQTVSSVFYNDDPSGTSVVVNDDDAETKSSHNSKRAHAKGVLLMDEQSGHGVWLTHSIPRFPNVRDNKSEYPQSGRNNGQTFMCINFDISESGKKIVDHLVNMRPLVYDNRISDKLLKLIPALDNLEVEKVIKGRRIKVSPKLSQYITTRGGQVLQIFSKSTKFNQDLYAGWIDEEIGSDLYVETWRLGSGDPLNSSCPLDDHHINNVKELKYDSSIQWAYSKDHSKWAISEQENVGVVCIGDSNRMQSQFKRGGGAVCIKCPTCWSIFDYTIQDVEPCPKGGSRVKKTDPPNGSLIASIKQTLHL